MLLLMFAIAAPAAMANLEQVTVPPVEQGKGDASNLDEINSLAVNATGAGGVPAGTVYGVARLFSSINASRLVKYSPNLEFIERVRVVEDATGIAISQATGNIYVLTPKQAAGEKGVTVYNPDGSGPIESFGEIAALSESIAASPEKLHQVAGGDFGGIAVDNAGTVYIADNGSSLADEPEGVQSRVMVFKPQGPGPAQNYTYAGRANDLAASSGSVSYGPRQLALDDAGYLYTASGLKIYKFSLAAPGPPLCEYEDPNGGIRGMTVNPLNGEVFYDSYKDGKGHRLTCNGEGQFVEQLPNFSISPKVTASFFVEGFTYNPSYAYKGSAPGSETHPPGALYAVNRTQGLGFIFAPPISHEPEIEAQSVSSVLTSSATLNAQINPKGGQTDYAFEYLTAAAYQENGESFAGASKAPPGGAPLGGGQKSLKATASVTGLLPDTEYRYRVVATSPEGQAIGEAESFKTYPIEAPGLPDNRAWELVSPADKHGGEVLPAHDKIASCGPGCKPGSFMQHFPMQSAPDGKRVVYEGLPFSPGGGAVSENEYLSHRTGSGWQTTTLSPTLQSIGEHQGFKGFKDDLTQGLLYQKAPALAPSAPSGFANLYAQPTGSPATLSALLQSAPPNRLAGISFNLIYAGASADFSKLFFAANDALTAATLHSPPAVDGGAAKYNLYEWSEGTLSLVNVDPGNGTTAPGAAFGAPQEGEYIYQNLSHVISDDGSRVFWTSEGGQVYVRKDGEATEAIPDPAKFLTASASGESVLMSDGKLFDVDALATEPLDLTQGKGGFLGLVGQSDDLSRVHFVDTAVLDEAPNGHGDVAQSGKPNLYARNQGSTVFVATLVAGDDIVGTVGTSDWHASPVQRSAQASPDGRWVAFLSQAPLTGYDNVGPCQRLEDGSKLIVPCAEVFLYDSASGELLCPSCNPSGAHPLGFSTLRLINDSDAAFPQPRYLTNSGRLYFDSQDSLSARDTNDGVEDVYQYEPEGMGSCKRAGGCVSLISAGREPVDSNFLAMDEDGKNVFFTSRDQLTLKDKDELVDLYVARENGGIAAETEVARGECQGEACQPPPIPPNEATPASLSFKGAGNVKGGGKPNSRCPAGKRRASRRGKPRCVPRRSKAKHAKKHRRAAHHNRGGAK